MAVAMNKKSKNMFQQKIRRFQIKDNKYNKDNQKKVKVVSIFE